MRSDSGTRITFSGNVLVKYSVLLGSNTTDMVVWMVVQWDMGLTAAVDGCRGRG